MYHLCPQLLDECLRAICGFKGTEDLSDDKLLSSPFTYDYIKVKMISSAPSYGLESQVVASDDHPARATGSEQWCEAIEKQLASTLPHNSALVGYSNYLLFYLLIHHMFMDTPFLCCLLVIYSMLRFYHDKCHY